MSFSMSVSLTSVMGKLDVRRDGLVAAAILFAVLPLEISHLLSMVLGAAAYLMLQLLHPKLQRPKTQIRAEPCRDGSKDCKPWRPLSPKEREARDANKVKGLTEPVKELKEIRKPSVMPVVAPTFHANGFEAEVRELLLNMAPSAESDAAVAAIALAVQRAVKRSFPQAKAEGFACCNPLSSKAFGVAVPEVEITITTPLLDCKDSLKMQKSAVRTCTDLLVSSGTFKFRRSAFRGSEPKVTLVAQIQEYSVAVNVSVNTLSPHRCAELLAECGRANLQARDCILLVRRWAKDRGLSHAAKGHFSPYCWTVLAIYALQLEEVLPVLGEDAAASTSQRSAAELFQAFIHFYIGFDWTKPVAACVAGSTCTASAWPWIQDPFEPSNLASATPAHLERVGEELLRAQDLLSKDESLSQLLQPWAPDAEPGQDQ